MRTTLRKIPGLRKIFGLLLVACLLAPGAQAQSGSMDKLSLEALTAPPAGGSGGYAPSRHRAARAYHYRAYRHGAYRTNGYRHRALRGYGRYAQPRHGAYRTHAHQRRVLPGYGRYVQPRYQHGMRGRHGISLEHHNYYRPRFQHPRFTRTHAFHAVRRPTAFVQHHQGWHHGN